MWSACAVYVNYTLTEMCGEIKDYDFINYSEYSHRSERHDNATEPLFLDLKFYPRQAAISPAAYDAATIVTIHYEAEKGRAAGILGKPLIGDDAAVRNIVSRDNRFYTVQYSLAALIIAIFIFLCFLKRTRFFLPHVMIMIGVFGILVSAFSLAGATGIPYMWKAVESCSYAFAIFSALLTLKVRTGKFPLWGVTLALAGAYCAGGVRPAPRFFGTVRPRIIPRRLQRRIFRRDLRFCIAARKKQAHGRFSAARSPGSRAFWDWPFTCRTPARSVLSIPFSGCAHSYFSLTRA